MMTTQGLIGIHKLQGIEEIFNYQMIGIFGDEITTNAFIIRLDDINFVFAQDPSDGYRSYLSDVETTEQKPKYILPDILVRIEPSEDFNGIYIVDTITNSTVLELGTDYSDDYYPCCIMRYYPENLYVNSRDMTDEEIKIYEDILEEATEGDSNLFDNSKYVGEGNELILTADEARAISDSISDRFNDEEKELVKSINTKILEIANKGDYQTTYDIPIDPEIHFDKIRNFYVQNGFGCATIYGDDTCNTIQLCWQER